MVSLSELRALADYQLYEELKTACLDLRQKSSSATVLFALALVHLGEKDAFEKAYAPILARQNALSIDGLCDLAAIQMASFRIDDATLNLKQVLSKQPDHSLALARLGWCHMAQKNYEQALDLFTRSLAIKPQRLPVYINIIQIKLNRSEINGLQHTINQALLVLETKRSELPDIYVKDIQQRIDTQQLELWVASDLLPQAEQWLSGIKETVGEDEYSAWVTRYSDYLAEHDHHRQAQEFLHTALKDSPENLPVLLKSAEIAQVQGYTMQAAVLIKRAIQRDKNNSALWVKLSQACLHQMPKQARKAAEKACALAQALVENSQNSKKFIRQSLTDAKHALAMVESNEQNDDIAETLFKEILGEHPLFLPALQGLGHQKMQSGKIDEAIALFEQVKQIDPVKGYGSLIAARRFPEDTATLLQLEKAANTPSIEGSIRSAIFFQLAAAWEKRKDYKKAFELSTQANSFSQQFVKYNSKAHRNDSARIRYAFSKSLYEHRPGCGVDSTLPIYVVGMPRSGTTLVEQIISGHSQIFGAGEIGVIPQVIQGLNRWERHIGTGRRYPDCVDDLTSYEIEGIAGNILKELRNYHPDAKHIVDKLPHNFEHIGFIKFLFPNARIVSVRRDPRDIALSNYFTDYQAKHSGMGFAYDLTHIGEQLADHNLMMHHWNQIFPNEILDIHYEDIIDNLENSARKILAYIGVEWEPEVLNFYQLNRSVKTASVWQVRQPIYKTSKAKWKHYKDYLAPLIKGTNAKIKFDKIKMISLPEPGLLTNGIELYRKGDLDAAELSFKKMLHHNPEHAACHYMVGLIYLSQGYLTQGIERIKKALDKCPWQKGWQATLHMAIKQKKPTKKCLQQKAPGPPSPGRHQGF